ncbi:MAG: septum formation initiator family protein [Lapillicoccus sp.]
MAEQGRPRAAAGRPTARPASRRSGSNRPAASARARAEAPGPAQGNTAWVRGAVLATILVLLAVTLLPTARSVIRQRSEIAALHEQISNQTTDVAALEAERARWNDPAYVEQQARERLKFVKPGERSYSVIDPDKAAPTIPAGALVAAPASRDGAPWYGQLWQSVQLADRPTAGMAPVSDK